jgi:uncharacterized RDD family membrane protein YckC/ribosomal protein L40E
MRCPTCHEENSELATVCRICGTSLVPEAPSAEPAAEACSRCGSESPADAAYCRICGLDLASAREAGVDQSLPQEAVAQRDYATFWIRLAAWAVDTGILTGVQLVLAASFGDLGVVGLILLFAYRVLFTGIKGQTPGKMLLGIAVINERGEVPGIGRALVREVPGRLLSEVSLGLGYVWAAWDDKKQAWHDKLARTYVVRKPAGSVLRRGRQPEQRG